MNAVAGDRRRDLAAVAEIDCDLRHRTHRLPMQDEVVAHLRGDLRIRIQDRSEESRVRAAEILIEIAEEAEGKDRFVLALRGCFRFVEIGVPMQTGDERERGEKHHAISVDQRKRAGCELVTTFTATISAHKRIQPPATTERPYERTEKKTESRDLLDHLRRHRHRHFRGDEGERSEQGGSEAAGESRQG